MKNKVGLIVVLVVFVIASAFSSQKDGGFDQWGYNRDARIFKGTGMNWCLGKGLSEDWCESYLGIYANDQIVMKWNAEWDRGNEEEWANPPYDAWEDNQWNGMFPGGSGETWHYKYQWVGPCGTDCTCLRMAGTAFGAEFEVIMSHGTAGGHMWDVLASPAGYGS